MGAAARQSRSGAHGRRMDAVAPAGSARQHRHRSSQPEPILLADGRLMVLPAPLRRSNESADADGMVRQRAGSFPALCASVSPTAASPAGFRRRRSQEPDRRGPGGARRPRLSGARRLARHAAHRRAHLVFGHPGAGPGQGQRSRQCAAGAHRAAGRGAGGRAGALGHYLWHDLKRSVHGHDDVAVLAEKLRGLGSIARPARRRTQPGGYPRSGLARGAGERVGRSCRCGCAICGWTTRG